MSMAEARAGPVMRPLRILVPLIKEDLRNGDEAGMPYYRAAGEKLHEAKAQNPLTFTKWCKINFDRSTTQIRLYMSYAATLTDQSDAVTSLEAFQRSRGMDRPSSGRLQRDWTQSVDAEISKIKLDILNTRRAEMERADEAKALRDVMLRTIEIGYKVLANELHPDKGGSHAAMSRLNEGRRRLKAFANSGV